MKHVLVHAPQNREHDRWGLPIYTYPKLYTSHGITARFQTSNSLVVAKNADWRSIAIATISDICKLDQSAHQLHATETAAARITLQRLKSVLELTCFPNEFENFALPRLTTGCLVLMLSVQPSPFFYEYGFLCFRILVISFNTCSIKHGRNLDYTIQRMKSAPPGKHFSLFWQGAADLLVGELGSIARLEKRLTNIINPGHQQFPVLELPKIDALLDLLHRDRKHFLVCLMTIDSLQLSGLMLVFWKYIESEKKTRNKDDYTRHLLLPYSRIFRRYQLVFSEIAHETDLVRLLFFELTNKADLHALQEKSFVDVEDSRNAIHAYNQCLKTSHSILSNDSINFMAFVLSVFAPGSEDLLPSIVDSTFGMLWNTWSQSDMNKSIVVLQSYGSGIRRFFDEYVGPLGSRPEPWRFDLVDGMLNSDVLELGVIIVLTWSQSHSGIAGGVMNERIKNLFDALISCWEKVMDHSPKEYFEKRLRESGAMHS